MSARPYTDAVTALLVGSPYDPAWQGGLDDLTAFVDPMLAYHARQRCVVSVPAPNTEPCPLCHKPMPARKRDLQNCAVMINGRLWWVHQACMVSQLGNTMKAGPSSLALPDPANLAAPVAA